MALIQRVSSLLSQDHIIVHSLPSSLASNRVEFLKKFSASSEPIKPKALHNKRAQSFNLSQQQDTARGILARMRSLAARKNLPRLLTLDSSSQLAIDSADEDTTGHLVVLPPPGLR